MRLHLLRHGGATLNYVVPPFSSPPFIVNLMNTLTQMQSNCVVEEAYHNSRHLILRKGDSTKVQSLLYPAILRSLYALPALLVLVLQRLRSRHDDVEWDQLTVDWDTLRKYGGLCGMAAIKTWLGSWTTSHRMHELYLSKCFFCGHDVLTNGATLKDSDSLDTTPLPFRPGMYSRRA